MSLLHGTVNPLNVLGFRITASIPDHFEKITVPERTAIHEINLWIYKNLNSRYCIKKSVALDDNNKLCNEYTIGIEDPAELSLFLLSCPYLNNR